MKRAVILLLFVLLLLNNVNAISSDMKENYDKKETIIVEISGIIIEPLSKAQVEFRRMNVIVPLEYDLQRISDKYYIWAIAPEIENNYSLLIKDIVSSVSGNNIKINYEKNFSVGKNITDYYVKPGFLSVEDSSEIKIYSNLDLPQKIKIDFPQDKEIEIIPGENNLILSRKDSEMSFTKINLGKYSIPLFFTKKDIKNQTSNENSPNYVYELYINPARIESTILKGEMKKYSFSVQNKGRYNLTNLYFEYDRQIFRIEPDEKFNLQSNFSQIFNMSLIKPFNDSFNGVMYLKNNQFSLPLEIMINRTDDSDEVSTKYYGANQEEAELLRCNEVPGIVCSSKYVCSSEGIVTSDGLCCPGVCLEVKSSGKSWIGYAIISFLIVLAIFIWFRYYRVRSEKNIMKKKIFQAEQNENTFKHA